MNFTIDDINKNALYILKIDSNGKFYTEFLEIDKKRLVELEVSNLYEIVYSDPKNDNLKNEELYLFRKQAILDFYEKIYKNHKEFYGFRNYCSQYAIQSAYCQFQGINSNNEIKISDYSNINNDLRLQNGENQSWKDIRDYTDEFFDSYFIEKAYEKCMVDKEIKVYSHRRVGWTAYNYTLNNILSVEISTNFSYGSASYFVVTLIYDGIQIIPYSRLVIYYFADAIQLIRHTREYQVYDDSWMLALNFIRDACNDFHNNGSESFIANYVINECRKLIELLPKYLYTNTFYLSENLNGRYNYKEDKIKSIELKGYDLIMFRAEKVAGAVDFTESIRKLSKLIPTQKYIDCINDCCINVLPELSESLEKLSDYLIELELKHKILSEELEHTKGKIFKIKPIVENYNNLEIEIRKEVFEKHKNLDGVFSYNSIPIINIAIDKIKEIYPDYENTINNKNTLEKTHFEQNEYWKKLGNEISKHFQYKKKISDYRTKVESYMSTI